MSEAAEIGCSDPTTPSAFHHPAESLSPLHSGIRVATFIGLHLVAISFPLAAGLCVYGWRALGTTLCIAASTVTTMFILRQIGWRGRQIRLWHSLLMAIIVSMMLPAHLFTLTPTDGKILWPILPATGILLGLLTWLLGGLGAQRVPPSVVTILILFVLFHEDLTPRYVLRVDRLFTGDLLNVDPKIKPLAGQRPWYVKPEPSHYDSMQVKPTGDELLSYTSAQLRPDRASLTMQMMIRDRMPPLENLIVAGETSPIGTGSALAVIIGGLFLLYQGLIDFRIPLLGTLSAMASLLILPIPIFITNATIEWRWLAFREHLLGWATALTFVNYEVMASPLLFMLIFLATAPGLRPITRRGRTVFAFALGILSAISMLYASESIGPYVALLIVALLTPTLERFLRPRTLV